MARQSVFRKLTKWVVTGKHSSRGATNALHSRLSRIRKPRPRNQYLAAERCLATISLPKRLAYYRPSSSSLRYADQRDSRLVILPRALTW